MADYPKRVRFDSPESLSIVDTSKVAGRLAWSRVRRGLTQQALAELAGKSRTAIAQYEKGKLHPPMNTIIDLAKALGVEPDFIAFGKTAPQAPRSMTIPSSHIEQGIEHRDGEIVFDGRLADDLGLSGSNAKIIELTYDAPYLRFRAKDRLIINTAASLDADGHLYFVRSKNRVDLVRCEGWLGADPSNVYLTTSQGVNQMLARTELEVIGKVVGSIRREGIGESGSPF